MLVNAYSGRIFNLAYQFSGTFQEAEALTQDIFMKIYTSLTKYDFQKNFSAWILTLAKNYLIDHYRKTKWSKKNRDDLHPLYLATNSTSSPENSLIREENKKILWQALNHLSPEVRLTLILRDIQGTSYEEIAEIMELTLVTIKSRVNRGTLQLVRILKENKEKENEM